MSKIPLRYAIPDFVLGCINLNWRIGQLERGADKARTLRDYATIHLLNARVLLLARASLRPPLVSRAHMAIGASYWETQEFDAALAAYQESHSIERKLGNQAHMAHAVRCMGSILVQKGDWVEGERLLRESLEEHKSLNSPVGAALCLSHLAYSAYARHIYLGSLPLALEAADLFGDNERPDGRAESLYFAALALLEMERFEEAESVTAEVLSMHRLELPDRLAHGLSVRGWQRFGVGDNAGAESLLKEALDLAVYEQNLESMQLIAQVHWQCGHVETSIGILDQCLDAFGEPSPPHYRALIAGAIGYYQIPIGMLEEAFKNLKEGLQYHRESGDKKAESYALNNLGNVHVKRGEFSEAANLYRESLQMKAETGDDWGASYSFEGLARCEVQRGNANRAARLLGTSFAIRSRLHAPIEMPLKADLADLTSTVQAALIDEDYRREFAAGQSADWKDVAVSAETTTW